jgi:hypothetical protein
MLNVPIAQRATLSAWAAARVNVLMGGLGGAVDVLTNAVFQAGVAGLTAQMQAANVEIAASNAAATLRDTRAIAREVAADAPQTFSGRFKQGITNEMMNITGVADEAHLPATLVALGSNKHKSLDTTTLRQAIDARARDPTSLGTEWILPVVSPFMVLLFREYNLTTNDMGLKGGLSPFPLISESEGPRATKTKELTDSLLRAENGDAKLSLADTEAYLLKEANLPASEYAAAIRLRCWTVVVDVMLGRNHAVANSLRNEVRFAADWMSSYMQSVVLSPTKRAIIALRIMLWFTQQLFFWIDEVKVGTVGVPNPNFAEARRQLRMGNYEGGWLPTLPDSWMTQESRTEGPPAPPSDSSASAGSKGEVVQFTEQPKQIKERWKKTGFKTIAALLTSAKEQGKIPPAYPNVNGKELCMGWCLLGRCNSKCKRADVHKGMSAAQIAATHKYLDGCGVAPLPSTSA